MQTVSFIRNKTKAIIAVGLTAAFLTAGIGATTFANPNPDPTASWTKLGQSSNGDRQARACRVGSTIKVYLINLTSKSQQGAVFYGTTATAAKNGTNVSGTANIRSLSHATIEAPYYSGAKYISASIGTYGTPAHASSTLAHC